MQILIDVQLIVPPPAAIDVTLGGKVRIADALPSAKCEVQFCGVSKEATAAADLPGLRHKLCETIKTHFQDVAIRQIKDQLR